MLRMCSCYSGASKIFREKRAQGDTAGSREASCGRWPQGGWHQVILATTCFSTARGRALYEELEKRLSSIGVLNLYACIADPIEEDERLTRDSERFHAHMGFEKVGEFHKCAFKFDCWYNMIWMEEVIGRHV